MRKLTDFGLSVKTELLRKGETMEWLIGEVKSDTSMFIDSSYLCRILQGERSPQKIIASICKILDLDEPHSEAS